MAIYLPNKVKASIPEILAADALSWSIYSAQYCSVSPTSLCCWTKPELFGSSSTAAETHAEALGSAPPAAIRQEMVKMTFSSSISEDVTDGVSSSVCGFTVHDQADVCVVYMLQWKKFKINAFSCSPFSIMMPSSLRSRMSWSTINEAGTGWGAVG